MSRASSYSSSNTHSTVILHIYDVSRSSFILDSVGLGQYHSAICYRNTEWTFADEVGIIDVPPKQYPGGQLKQEIVLGETDINFTQFQHILNEMKKEFTPDAYDVLSKNCNHFSDALAKALFGTGIPSFVNRSAKIGAFFSRFLPKETKQNMKQAQKQNANSKELHQKTHKLRDVDDREALIEMVQAGLVDVQKAESLNHHLSHTLQHLLQGKSHFQTGVESDCVLYLPFKSSVRLTELRFTCHDPAAAPHTIRLFKNQHGDIDLDNVEDLKCDQILTLDKSQKGKKKGECYIVELKRVKWKGVRDLTIFVRESKGSEYCRIDKLEVVGRVEGSMDLQKLGKHEQS